MADDGDRQDTATSAGDGTTDGGRTEETHADVGDTGGGSEEWQYSIDDVSTNPADPTAESTEDETGETGEDDEYGGNVAGEVLDLEESIEPGSPSTESAFFFVLGVVVTILFFLTAAGVL